MNSYIWLIWLAAAVVFAMMEAATINVVSIWFVGGALAALVTQLLGGTWLTQILVFAIVSAVLLACLRPFVKRFVAPKKVPTNIDAILGKQAVITQGTDGGLGIGTLKLDGKEWSVRSQSGEPLPEGCVVQIVKIEGVTLYAQPISATVS